MTIAYLCYRFAFARYHWQKTASAEDAQPSLVTLASIPVRQHSVTMHQFI